jgi:hypothetical protein
MKFEFRALVLALLDRIRAKSDLNEDAAMKLAYEELHAMRNERRRATD